MTKSFDVHCTAVRQHAHIINTNTIEMSTIPVGPTANYINLHYRGITYKGIPVQPSSFLDTAVFTVIATRMSFISLNKPYCLTGQISANFVHQRFGADL